MITLNESLKQNAVFGKLKCLISNNIINHINQIILIYLVIMFDWRLGFIGHEQILVGHPMTESYFQLCRKTKQGNEAGKSRGDSVGTSLSVVITGIRYLIWRPLNQKKMHFLRNRNSIHNIIISWLWSSSAQWPLLPKCCPLVPCEQRFLSCMAFNINVYKVNFISWLCKC